MNKEQELLLTEVIVKTFAIERLLVKHNILTSDEIISEMKKISDEVLTLLKVNSEQIFGQKN